MPNKNIYFSWLLLIIVDYNGALQVVIIQLQQEQANIHPRRWNMYIPLICMDLFNIKRNIPASHGKVWYRASITDVCANHRMSPSTSSDFVILSFSQLQIGLFVSISKSRCGLKHSYFHKTGLLPRLLYFQSTKLSRLYFKQTICHQKSVISHTNLNRKLVQYDIPCVEVCHVHSFLLFYAYI